MSKKNSKNEADLIAWQAHLLRLTCFTSSAANFDPTNWWLDITGEQPENTVVRAREGFRQDDGIINEKKLILGVQPTRVNLLMQSTESENQTPIGLFTDNLDPFLAIVSRWFKVAPPLTRIAFGAVLIFPVADRETGYEMLAKLLPKIQIDSVNSSDFLYQINRPRTSHTITPKLKINRLTKWSVQKSSLVHFVLSPSVKIPSTFPSNETVSCRLELDINTSEDFKSDLPQNKLMNIFEELVELAKEITIKGDVP